METRIQLEKMTISVIYPFWIIHSPNQSINENKLNLIGKLINTSKLEKIFFLQVFRQMMMELSNKINQQVGKQHLFHSFQSIFIDTDLTIGDEEISPRPQEAYCNLCERSFCNKYFLKTHLAKKHAELNLTSPISSIDPNQTSVPSPSSTSNDQPLPLISNHQSSPVSNKTSEDYCEVSLKWIFLCQMNSSWICLDLSKTFL